MSMRYKGSVISATPPTTSTTTATGVWTLPQQMQAQGAGNWPYGGPFTYIEDVFSTYLYTGTAAPQTITNGIDLSTNGGLVWYKRRTGGTGNNVLADTVRGMTSSSSPLLFSNATDAQTAINNYVIAGTTGYSLGSNATGTDANGSGSTYVSWTFRKQPKFFDVVTYTGTGSARTIPHNLGSVPGCIIVKAYTTSGYGWRVYHTGLGATQYLSLETSTSATTSSTTWNNTSPTSTNFTVGTDVRVNEGTVPYIAYLFAHNAGGFGTSGNDNVITCGSVDGATTQAVNLGYEPQWLLLRDSQYGGRWILLDTMRGFTANGTDNRLWANLTDAEDSTGGYVSLNATGFNLQNNFPGNLIYIAIRRGPMKVPTVGTSVFSPVTRTGNNTFPTAITSPGFAPSALFSSRSRNNTWQVNGTTDKLRGSYGSDMSVTSAETAFYSGTDLASWSNVGYVLGVNSGGNLNQPGVTYVDWVLQRAPGFFDEVCYTGTGSATTQTHNLGAVPELIIVKSRSNSQNWFVYSGNLGNTIGTILNLTNASADYGSALWNSTTPTSSVFSLGTNVNVNNSGSTYVAYLFATCPGVSKVGSYTGTGATQTIDCGFTGGARFVLIKRSDSTGDWYVWDTARGMVSGTDPSLLLNSIAVEVNANSVYTTGVGFQIVSTAAGINASGGTYIFLAVA